MELLNDIKQDFFFYDSEKCDFIILHNVGGPVGRSSVELFPSVLK